MRVSGEGKRGGRLVSVAFFLSSLLAPVAARADDAAEQPGPSIRFSGRIFARAAADERQEFQRELSIPSARLQVEGSLGIASAVLEADVASSSLVKDAFVRLGRDEGSLFLYAGQFKAPFLARKLESSWSLPLVSRGLVNDYLVETHQLAGRRIGVMGEWRRDAWRDLRVQVGAFQGAKDEIGQRLGEDVAARVSFEPLRKVDLAVSGYWADAPSGLHRYAGGADARVRLGGFTANVEALAGRLAIGDFTAQLGRLTYALPVGGWVIEPVAGYEELQLRGEVSGVGRAGVVGVNLHASDGLKLMVQGERGLFPGDTALRNRFTAQLGARF